MIERNRIFIDGNWVRSSGSELITVTNPAADVWCGDAGRARAIAARLRVGRVRINGAALSKYGPHGGFKLSGIGREWGRLGIEEFLEYKSIIG